MSHGEMKTPSQPLLLIACLCAYPDPSVMCIFFPQAKLEVAATLGEGKEISDIKGQTLACVRKGNFSGAEASVLWFCRGRRSSGDHRYSIDLNQISISFIWRRLNAEPMRVY